MSNPLNQIVFNACTNSNFGLNKIKDLVSRQIVDINYIDPKTGQTILHIAVKRSNTELIIYLLGKNINIEVVDKDGKTALHYASCQYVQDIVNRLMEDGVGIYVIDNTDAYPLHCHTVDVTKRCDLNNVKIFCTRARDDGCEVSFCTSQDKFGWTSLHYACILSYDEMSQCVE